MNITVDLDNIDEAIRAVRAYRERLKWLEDRLLQAMTDVGVKGAVALLQIYDGYESGETMGTIAGYSNPNSNKALIVAGGAAAWIEFGTGVGGADHPHLPEGLNWQRNEKGHGEAGWWYFDEKQHRARWTKGTPSRPFMWKTAQMLIERCPEIATEVFGGG